MAGLTPVAAGVVVVVEAAGQIVVANRAVVVAGQIVVVVVVQEVDHRGTVQLELAQVKERVKDTRNTRLQTVTLQIGILRWVVWEGKTNNNHT